MALSLEMPHRLQGNKSQLLYSKMTLTRAQRFVYTFPRSGPSDVCDPAEIRASMDPYV